jgi:hypothetical protein
MNIPENVLQNIVKQTVNVGDVFLLDLDQTDGVTPKGGDESRKKFFVVLGFDNEGNVYGGVIINSRINQHMSQLVKDYHMPIKSSKYSFLKYDSFVDCLQLKTAPLAKLSSGNYKGKMDAEDLELIIGTIKNSPVEKVARLKQFGIVK